MNGKIQGRQEAALREQLEQMIEAARAEIELAIATAERAQHEGEGAEQIEALKAQLATLDGHSNLIRSGSLAQLQQMQTVLPRAVSAILRTPER